MKKYEIIAKDIDSSPEILKILFEFGYRWRTSHDSRVIKSVGYVISDDGNYLAHLGNAPYKGGGYQRAKITKDTRIARRMNTGKIIAEKNGYIIVEV